MEDHLKNPAGESAAAVQAAMASDDVAPNGAEAKERLQRFDLVIQHLHRLRATLALDSSVRELQKLQTLTILGQTLLPPAPAPASAAKPIHQQNHASISQSSMLMQPPPTAPHHTAGAPNFLNLRPQMPNMPPQRIRQVKMRKNNAPVSFSL